MKTLTCHGSTAAQCGVLLLMNAMLLMAALPAAAAPLAYVPITQPAGVQVIDLGTNSVVATIPLTNNPSEVAVTPDGKTAYVTQRTTASGGFANTVVVIATATNTITGSITVGEEPDAIAISPNGQFVYVANTDWNSVWVIETGTNSVVATIPVGSGPTGLAFSPDGSFLYVANILGNSISVIDTSRNIVAATIPITASSGGLAGSGDIAISPDGDFLYVADYASGDVSVVKTASRRVVSTIKTAVSISGIAVTPNGKSVYVVSGAGLAGYNASVIDTATNTIKTNIPLDASAVYGQVAISPDGAYVYVTYAGKNIIVIGTAMNAIVGTIPSGTTCGPLAFLPTPAQGITLSSLTVNPAAIIGGAPATGTVTLTSAAPVGGAVISLSSANPAVILPASVTVTAGAATGNFTLSTQTVTLPTQATVTAAWNNVTKTASLILNPRNAVLSGVSVNPASVVGGTSATGTVTLTGPAPAGGFTVDLWTQGSPAFVPTSIVIPQGSTSATFPVTTIYTAAAVADIITAFYQGTETEGSLTVNPALAVASLALGAPLVGGTSATGVVTLNGPAPSGGITVDLWTDGAPAFVPVSINIPAGSNTGTFTISTIYTSTTVQRTVTAFYNGAMTSAKVTVIPFIGARFPTHPRPE